jgi:hypothetical protein
MWGTIFAPKAAGNVRQSLLRVAAVVRSRIQSHRRRSAPRAQKNLLLQLPLAMALSLKLRQMRIKKMQQMWRQRQLRLHVRMIQRGLTVTVMVARSMPKRYQQAK